MTSTRVLVDQLYGRYVGQRFALNYDLSTWTGIDPDEIEILKAGPEHEHYDETLDDVISSASYVEANHTWKLHMDGDLFAVCPELMDNEEYEKMFDSMKPEPEGSYTYMVCGECMNYLANGEHHPDATIKEEQAIEAGFGHLRQTYQQVNLDGAGYGFKWSNCECCGALAGDRYRVICMNKPEPLAFSL